AGRLRAAARGDRRGDRHVRTLRCGLPAQVRVAAVDLGTNTTRLLVADVDDGRIDEVHRETHITRLGEGVDARKRLHPVPIARVRNVLADYRRTLERLGAERTLAVATSAVRDAENGEAFLGEIEWSYGFATRLVSGDDEAMLTRRGVQPAAGTFVLDIGGGSTELIVAGALILTETLGLFGLDAFEVSERDILDGIELAAAELPAPEEGAAPPGAYTYC